MSIADKITRLQTAKTNIAAAITAKGGTVAAGDGFEDFATKIMAIPTSPYNEMGHTGTVDRAGLIALGWNDNDINYLQECCWWDAEDNAAWAVTEANKAYGPNGTTPITTSNYGQYLKDPNLRYFPKLPELVDFYEYSDYPIYVIAIPTDGITMTDNALDKLDYCTYLIHCGHVLVTGSEMGYYLPKLKNIKITLKDTGWNCLEEMASLKSVDISSIIYNSSDRISLVATFENCPSLEKIKGFNLIDFSKVTSCSDLFSYCYNLSSIKFTNYNFSNCTSFAQMFMWTSSLTDASWFGNFIMPENSDIGYMFRHSGITKINLPELKASFNLYYNPFYGCSKLREIGSSGKISVGVDFSDTNELTRESCLVLFNALDADNPNTIHFHSWTIEQLSDADKAIATDKGWTIA